MKLRVTVGEKKIKLPEIVVEGSHFKVLLGVNWVKKSGAEIDLVTNTVQLGGQALPIKGYKSLGAHAVQISRQVHSRGAYWMAPGET